MSRPDRPIRWFWSGIAFEVGLLAGLILWLIWHP
jgi:hypothetical protein